MSEMKPSAAGFRKNQWRIGKAANDSATPPDPNVKMLRCTVTGASPRFISPDGTFAIWSAVTEYEDSEQAVTIKGPLGRVAAGEMLDCKGDWKQHKDHGWSFQVNDFRSALPTSSKGVAIWLEQKVPGVGPTFAEAIVDHFGNEQVFNILDEDPTRLREVRTKKGRALPSKQVEKAIEAWGEVKAIRQVEAFMYSHGVTANLGARLYRHFGPDIVEILRTNPYRITTLSGVGFKTADAIALSMGTAVDDPKRMMAAILFVLTEASNDGHTFLSLQQMCGHVITVLTPAGSPEPPREVRDPAKIVEAASMLTKGNHIIVEDDEIVQQRVYSKIMHNREVRVAAIVRHLLETPGGALFPPPVRPVEPANATAEQLSKLKLPTDAQWSVVEMVRSNRLALLTGGPGTGKTHSQLTLVKALEAAGKKVMLCAPTGKAARRMTELTGHPATTIHRALEFSPQEGGFMRDETNPMETDVLIVDESSMLALDLADSLFRAVGEHTHVLLVGDPDQLPPVGAGKVLDDLIRTEAVPRVHLGKVHRQAAKSMIIQNARRINRGKMPYLRKEEAEASLGQEMLNDFFWVTRKTPEETFELVMTMVCRHLPRAFDLDPVKDILVLAPMAKGPVGLKRLNEALELALNGGADKPVVVPNRGIRVGSRIVQTKNDHNREIMNGELALVLDYDAVDKACRLSLDDGDRELIIPAVDMETFHLAWAMSIHKAQGSEAKCIVTPVSSAHYVMLSRALTYTAVTRAKELCVMVGEKRALSQAVGKVEMKKRNSYLAQRILDARLSGQLF